MLCSVSKNQTKEQSKKFLLGQVMRETKGQADPKVSAELINKILENK